MRVRVILRVLTIAALATTGRADESTGERPRLEATSFPRVVVAPSSVIVTAKLVGGQDLEDYYCPEVEWEWTEGDRSSRLSDCEPYEPGDGILRVFTARHRFLEPGHFNITIRLRRDSRVVASASVSVDVHERVIDSR